MSLDRSLTKKLRDSDRLREFAGNRQAFRDDPYLPRYHLVPPGGLLHDPNGALYWNGRYHLFYQFWPPDVSRHRSWSEAMHWGHAVSEDLIHWTDLPVALSPDGGPENGCFSGQALVEDDRVVLMYFGTEAGNCIATAEGPFLTDVEKHPENPVIPLEEGAPYDVFDPCLWRDDGTYYSLSGGLSDGRTAEFLFESANLADWAYLGPLIEDGYYTDPGEDGAVPNFFELDGSHVLLFFSHTRGPQYYVGEYDSTDHTFEVESHGRLNHGPVEHSNLHAPSVLEDGAGRRVAFFNIVEGRENWAANPGEGWAGVISLPRRLTLSDGDLRVAPVKEVEALRTNHRRIESEHIPANEEWVIPDVGGKSLELRAEMAVRDAQEITLSVLRSPGGEEQTSITYWDAVDSVGIDTGRSTRHPEALARAPEIGPLSLAEGELLDLRVFVDRSVVEVFANGRQSLTTRVYPERTDSVGVSVQARRGPARLESMDVWDMRSIWPPEG
ncbi:MAG: glycoside hydrolase family 32 protein [Halobacteriales archaeon]